MRDENGGRDDHPTANRVACPSCNESTYAIVPKGTTIIADDEAGDGTVWAICTDCENRFLVSYQHET